MKTTMLILTSILLASTLPLASAGGIPLGARVGQYEVCYVVLGDELIEEGCQAPCALFRWCDADPTAAVGAIELG